MRRVLAVIALTLMTAACGGDVADDPATPTASPSAPATATARPAVSQTASPSTTPGGAGTPSPNGTGAQYGGYNILGDFRLVEAIDFPPNTMMLIETGCSHCDGPTDGLYRVWRNDGKTHAELIVDAALGGTEDGYITSYAIRPTLSDIVVTVCTQCAGGSFLTSPVEVYRSIDGGISWRNIFTAPPGQAVFAEAITDQGLVFSNLDGDLFYLRGQPIDTPEGINPSLPAADQLLASSRSAGELRWVSEDGRAILDSDGTPLSVVEPGSLVDSLVDGASDASQVVTGWALNYRVGPFEGWVVSRIGPDGKHTGFKSDAFVGPVARLEGGALLGNLLEDEGAPGGSIGLIDLSRGVLTPIHAALVETPFGDGEEPLGRNKLAGAVSGPFLRVDTGGSSSCLPIRATQDLNSRELVCAANGTLVYDLKGTASVGAQQWSRIRLLDGREGYAVSSYLSDE